MRKLKCRVCKTRIAPHPMSSVDAMDMMKQCLVFFRTKKEPLPEFIAKLKEQIEQHRRALRHVIGWESI